MQLDDRRLVRLEALEHGGSHAIQHRIVGDQHAILQRSLHLLVDLHGQDSAKLLLQRDFQLAWIDANAKHPQLLSAYKSAYAAFKAAQDRLAQLELKRSQPQTDLDYIRYQLEELQSLGLDQRDWPALLEERDVRENSEAIRASLAQAFAALNDLGLTVRHPERTVATVDHIVPTTSQSRPFADPLAEEMLSTLERNCAEHGIVLNGLDNETSRKSFFAI